MNQNRENNENFLTDLFGLQGKVAVAVGGSGVLGGAMAEALAFAGAKVAILGRTLAKVESAAVRIAEKVQAEAMPVQVDAGDKNSLLAAKEKILKNWQRVDILINAPGINSTTPFFEISEKEWHEILDTNLKSTFFACQIFGEEMVQKGRGGSIINISSASAGPPLSKVFTYSVSKAGMNNLTQFLAREWAQDNIRVNVIAPGFFPAEQNRKILTQERTEDIFRHTPMKRFGNADELAGATIWLASEKASSFITGAIIHVDGGFSAMTI